MNSPVCVENVTPTNFQHQISDGRHSAMICYEACFHRPEQRKLVGNWFCRKELWYLYISSGLNQIFGFDHSWNQQVEFKNYILKLSRLRPIFSQHTLVQPDSREKCSHCYKRKQSLILPIIIWFYSLLMLVNLEWDSEDAKCSCVSQKWQLGL